MTSKNDRLIDDVLVDVIKQYEVGKQVNLDQVARTHSELGEELDERLRELPIIWDTYRRIGKKGSDDSWIIEDLNILRAALPQYDLHCEIHRGGQAVVYAATQAKTGRPVAVKFLTETGPHTARQRERFRGKSKSANGCSIRTSFVCWCWDCSWSPVLRDGIC